MIDLSALVPGSLIGSFSPWRIGSFRQDLSKALECLIWAIWKERNNQVFDNLIGDSNSVWDSFLFLIANWARKKLYHI